MIATTKDIELIKKLVQDNHVMVSEFARGYHEEITKLRERVAQQEQRPHSMITPELLGRIEALELWRGAVHRLLVEQTPTGRDKLTKTGKDLGFLYRSLGGNSQR